MMTSGMTNDDEFDLLLHLAVVFYDKLKQWLALTSTHIQIRYELIGYSFCIHVNSLSDLDILMDY